LSTHGVVGVPFGGRTDHNPGMEHAKEPSTALLEEARATNLVVTRRRLLRELSDEVIRRHLSNGQWVRVADGVYRLGPEAVTWSVAAVAVGARFGPSAVIGLDAAAYVHGLAERSAGPIPVWLPANQKREADLRWRPLRDSLDRARRAVVVEDADRWRGRLRVTSVEDTVLDIVDRTERRNKVTAMIVTALNHGLTRPEYLLDGLGQRPGLRHRRHLREFLRDAAGIESVLEERYRKLVEVAHSLPPATRQATITGHARADLAYLEWGVVIELDGTESHRGSAGRDRRRSNQLVLDDYVVLRYGWSDVVDSPCRVAREVARILRQRGWQGELGMCRACRVRIAQQSR